MGHASILDQRPAPGVDTLPAGMPPRQPAQASETSLAPGRALGITPLTVHYAMLSTYLNEIPDTDQIYLTEGLVHPADFYGWLTWPLLTTSCSGLGFTSAAAFAIMPQHGGTTTDAALEDRIEHRLQRHAIVKFDAIVTPTAKEAYSEIALSRSGGRDSCQEVAISRQVGLARWSTENALMQVSAHKQEKQARQQ